MTERLLIETNLALLRQAEALLETIDGGTYAECSAALAPHRAGGHMRHILEFYECFLDGLQTGYIDYDARKRDLAVEMDRGTALERMRLTMRRLERVASLEPEAPVWVRMEAHDDWLFSSAGRELQVLSSHTVHHFALIAVVLRVAGVPLDLEFGMAPSTLRHLAGAAPCAR